MPIWRLTSWFTEGGYGFTESWWIDSTSQPAQGPNSVVQKLMDKRLGFMSKKAFLEETRISQQGSFRGGQLWSYVTDATPDGLPGKYENSSVFPGLCMIIPIPPKTPGTISVSREFRGVAGATARNVISMFQPSPGLLLALQAFFAQLVADQWGWLGQTSRVQASVNSLVQATNGTVNVGAAGNLWTVLPSKPVSLRISGVQGASAVNGTRTVMPTTLSSFATVSRIPVFPYTAGGKVTVNNTGFVQANNPLSLNAIRIASRKPGRRAFLSAGRRRGKRVA